MEEIEKKVKEEIEEATAKLKVTQQALTESLEKYDRLRTEHEDQRNEHKKKLHNLSAIQRIQTTKLLNMDGELKKAELALNDQRIRQSNLLQMLEKDKNNLAKIKLDTKDLINNFKKTYAELDQKLKTVSFQIKCQKDFACLVEFGLSKIKAADKYAFVEEVYKMWKAAAGKRELEMKEEEKLLDESLEEVEAEVKAKEEELALLQGNYSSLAGIYERTKAVSQRV